MPKVWSTFLCPGANHICPGYRRNLLAKVLFGCLNGRDVSRGLILFARDFFNCMPKSGEIAHYNLQLLQ